MSTARYDVIVLGAGPSGSTAANLLAQEGHRVLLLEREVFPRFHIGESLLPCDLPIFRRLGVDPAARGFLRKGGAEFLDERIDGHAEYPFHDALPGTPDHAYQVDRATFDHWLAERARAVGAELHYDERATDFAVHDDRVVVTTDKGQYEARYFIDATGQDAVTGRRAKTTRAIEDFGLAATFTHFEGLSPEIDHELCVTTRGNIKVLFVEDGWCWAIPLGGRKISIGLVSRRRGIKPEWLEQTIAASPFLKRVTDGATRPRRPGVLASFSFHNQRQHGARFACTGDAACFLDPVFSSGVSLGMVGAAHLVDTLSPALRTGTEGDPTLADAHARYLSRGYNTFATLVHSFYHSGFMHAVFFSNPAMQVPELRAGLTAILAGDVFRDDNKFQSMLMSSARRRQDLDEASARHFAEGPRESR